MGKQQAKRAIGKYAAENDIVDALQLNFLLTVCVWKKAYSYTWNLNEGW